MKPQKVKIGLIGAGNMGEAIFANLLLKKIFTPSQIGIYEPNFSRSKMLKKKWKIVIFSSHQELVEHTQNILLAVKPQQMKTVLMTIRPFLKKHHLLLSIAAGVDTNAFYRILPRRTHLIRIMPNMCALIGEGVSVLYASSATKPADRSLALKIFSSTGEAFFISSEKWLSAVTAVSGSGPAFVYFLMDSFIKSGQKMGLPQELAKKLVLQTFLGSTRMAKNSEDSFDHMISQVTSKGGTTEAGLKIFKKRNLESVLEQAISAATKRSEQLRRFF